MKRFTMVALTALMVFALTVPAWALETQFGGYWRTRAYTQQNFTGEDQSEASDILAVDTRTRLYFTTIFHENLKFVNKFEYNTGWGDLDGGDIGADAADNFRIKNSYADFTLGAINAKVGIQGVKLSRGFLFDDDFSGVIMTINAGNFALPLIWMKAYEGGKGMDENDFDVDYYAVSPIISAGAVKINPFFLYAVTDEVTGWDPDTPYGKLSDSNAHEMYMWYAGLNLDFNFDAASIWMTGIYQGGDVDLGPVRDFKAFLTAAGFSVNLPFGDIHGQGFYATGDDGEDKDLEEFFVPKGQSYYWAEIMGLGVFDQQKSINAVGDKIGDIMAANVGVTIKPMDKLKISLDAWYAALAEDIPVNGNEENYLGTELDLKVTITLVQGLNLDLVGAYLFAGEATTLDRADEADPYEVGTRLSLSF